MPSLLAVAALAAATAFPASATSYSPCSSGSVMADGTHVRDGSAAQNTLPLGTRITVTPAPFGRRYWTVRDRIGWGTDLDLWTSSCAAARAYGRHRVTVRVGWHRSVVRARHGSRIVIRWPTPRV